MAIKTSVNIKFDIGNDEFVNRYIPSPSHTEALKGILTGFNNNTNSSHIVVGPYGTGKSLLATVVSSVVSNTTSEVEIEKLVNKFKHFDDNIADQIQKANNLKRDYIPVSLSGNEGRFREALLSSIIKSLKEQGLNIILPGVSEKIINSVQIWKEEYPDTYNEFLIILKEEGKKESEWLNEIKKQNEAEFEFFSELYPKLTSGATIDVGYNDAFVSQIEYISKKLEEQNKGLFIVYDEFGRFLQGLDSSRLNETMQDIQDLAEIVSRSDSFQLLLITHKSLRQYFKKNNNEVSKEFQRVEKRFSQYHTSSDQVTFLKIAEVILTENIKDKPIINNDQFLKTVEMSKLYPLFPSINPIDREENIIKSMYPMHPVSLFLLPNLSAVFGQNERTLFTFLESLEPSGLKSHMAKTDSYYMAHQLFNYFFPDLNDIDVETDVKEFLLLHKKALARIPDNLIDQTMAINTLRLITLWNICGLQNEQRISNDFLSFALEQDITHITALTKELSIHKVIRFNRLNNHWELNTGSTIDIQEKIEKRKNNFKLKQNDIHSILDRNLSKKYFFPEEYNDVKEMTRFAKVEIVLGDEVTKINTKVIKKSDVTLLYILPREENDINDIVKQINDLNLPNNVLCAIHSIPLRFINNAILESSILMELLQDKALLSEDKAIKEELQIIIQEVNHVIAEYLSDLPKFSNNIIWYNGQSEIKVKNMIEMSGLLSRICYKLYSHTPVILNDSFNRVNITSVQKKAAISLVDNILNNYHLDQFGINGNGPDYAIFASVFKRNGDFQQNVNSLDYTDILNASFKLLREKLISLLDNNPNGSFSDVINIFTETPFGIRKSIIPILLVGLLRDRWNEFMLYRNEMYISQLNGEKLFEILYEEGSENYNYIYERYDETYIEFFQYIEMNFSDYIETRLHGSSRLVKTCSTLLKWLRSLPRFTQLTNYVDSEFIALREYIKKTEVKPQESIVYIYENYYKKHPTKLLQLKEYAEKRIYNLERDLLNIIFKTCEVKNISELKEWASSRHEYLKKNNKLVNVIIRLDKEDWMTQFIEKYIGVQVSNWSDTTKNLYSNQLFNDYKEARNFSESNKEFDIGEKFISLDIAGEKKVISKVEFSLKTNTIYNNVNRMIKNAGRNIPKKEIEYMVYRLLEEYVE